MTRRLLAGLVFVAAVLGGCDYSWVGDSSVTLTDGNVYHCTALSFHDFYIRCGHGKGERTIEWKLVAGFRAGRAR